MRAVDFARACKKRYGEKWRWWRPLWASLTRDNRVLVTADDLPSVALCMLWFDLPIAVGKHLEQVRKDVGYAVC